MLKNLKSWLDSANGKGEQDSYKSKLKEGKIYQGIRVEIANTTFGLATVPISASFDVCESSYLPTLVFYIIPRFM